MLSRFVLLNFGCLGCGLQVVLQLPHVLPPLAEQHGEQQEQSQRHERDQRVGDIVDDLHSRAPCATRLPAEGIGEAGAITYIM